MFGREGGDCNHENYSRIERLGWGGSYVIDTME